MSHNQPHNRMKIPMLRSGPPHGHRDKELELRCVHRGVVVVVIKRVFDVGVFYAL